MFTIAPDIRRARTPPAALYTDADLFRRLMERVFPASWQLVPVDPLPDAPNTAAPFTLLPGSLDEPLLLTVDGTGATRCLSNVCTHRAALLLTEPCAGKGIRCPYHGRRFDLTGRMLSAPEFDDAADFPGPDDDLPELPLRHLGPLGFVRLDRDEGAACHPAAEAEASAAGFDAFAAPFLRRMGPERLGALRFSGGDDYRVEANWIAYCDNYLEGLHIPYVHPALARAVDYRAYRTELFPGTVLQVGTAAAHEPAFEFEPDHPHAGERVAALWFFLWPNLMLNVYPWGLSTNLVLPTGPGSCTVRFRYWVLDEALRNRGAGGDLDTVQREDEAVVLRVQRGLRSRLYGRGRYAPTREQGVHRFHRMLAAVLNEAS